MSAHPVHGVRRRLRVLTRALGIGMVAGLLAAVAATQPTQHSSLDAVASSGGSDLAQTHPASGPGTSIKLVSYDMHGQLVSRVIPGGTSAFPARRALIYLPPVLRQAPQTRLPVLMLLHGTPGGPAHWVQYGAVVQTMDAFAAAHQGLAPVVVMPDINGGPRSDTECVNSRRGNAEDYLTRVVPDYVRAHLPVVEPGRQWAVAGLSEGATCSLMFGLRHTSMFSTVGFFSGLARPTVGNTDARVATIRRLFGGSRYKYNHHDPLWLMRHATYPSLAVWLEIGTRDRQSRAAAAHVVAAARNAHVSTVVRSTPGGHQWPVWQTSLRQAMPWVWARIGS
ncbi:MAG TPA: alpha/beta hydrolase-fold protein [Marmoricola sp.]|nr:alpha/beta hydrolase-fold protein [Marmoricola sp.]